MLEQECDKALVERAVRGDGDSFTELCRRYYGAMVAIGHAIIRDRHLAEDAAQQAFAKAAVCLPRLRQADQFGRWVAAICRNEARDLAQAQRRENKGHSTSSVSPDGAKGEKTEYPLFPSVVPEPSDSDESVRMVREALGRLPEEAREVIFLRFYDDLSYDQISVVLGISEQAINGRLRRAKKQLARYLRRSGFDEVYL